MPSAKKKKTAPTAAAAAAAQNASTKTTESRRQKTQKNKGPSTSVPTTKQKEFPLFQFALILSFTALAPQLYRFTQFGITTFTGHAYWDLDKTPLQWKELIQNKTILTIGGAHRSGTTLLWKCISSHPDISGFGDQFRTGVSFSEGVLMQHVFPKHGVATELAMKNRENYKDIMEGVGKYALADESLVHLTEDSDVVIPDNLANLLNRYGSYWNLTSDVWVDKSPPSAVMSRAFQALYNVDIDGFSSSSSNSKTSPTKFLFTTRHPIANAFAHHHLLGGSNVVPFDILLQNYVQVHKYLMEDMHHLKNNPKLIKLEEFVANPATFLHDIFTWLNVDASESMIQRVITKASNEEGIRTNVNEKYRNKWCGGSVGPYKRKQVEMKYQPIMEELGLDYDLVGWCDRSDKNKEFL